MRGAEIPSSIRPRRALSAISAERLRRRVAKDSGLNYSVVVTAANVHDLIPVAGLLHGDEEVALYGA